MTLAGHKQSSKRSHPPSSSTRQTRHQPANNVPGPSPSAPKTQLTPVSLSTYRDAVVGGSQQDNLTIPRQEAPKAQDQRVSSSAIKTLQQASSSRAGASNPRAKYASFIPTPIYHLGAIIFNTLWGSHRAHIQQPVPEVQSSRSSINENGSVSDGRHHIYSVSRAELEKLRKDLEDQKAIARVLQEEVGIANGQYQSQLVAYEQLLGQKEKLSADQDRLLAENQDYAKRVSRLAVVVENKQLYVGPQESDYGITEQFEGLYRGVRDFSFPFLSEHQVPNALLDKDFRKMLWGLGLRSVEEFDSLLAVKKTRRLMVQSILGYCIHSFCFRRFAELDGLGESHPTLDQSLSQQNSVAINAIEQTLQLNNSGITQRELNDWRALTLTLVSRAETNIPGLNTHVEAERTQRKQAIVEKVMRWISDWAKPQEDRKRLSQELGVILDAAFQLSLLLRKQRACWFVRFPMSVCMEGLGFNPEMMEDILSKQMDDQSVVERQRGRRVSLVIFPGLHKRGDTYGENYESEICVVKAQVRCIDSVPDRQAAGELPDSRTGHMHASASATDHEQPAMRHPPYPPL